MFCSHTVDQDKRKKQKDKRGIPLHNVPTTLEQLHYRMIFESYYPSQSHLIPHFWMPNYTNATDASARTLAVYKKTKKKQETHETQETQETHETQ